MHLKFTQPQQTELFHFTPSDNIYPSTSQQQTIYQARVQNRPQKEEIPFVIYHPFNRREDSLMRLSLMYNVEVEEIKKANGMFSCDDDLSFFEEDVIIIPGPKYLPNL